MEKVAAQPVEYALRFSSPGHLANKDFPLISKDLWLYPRGRRVTAEAIKEICFLVISVLLISHLQQPNNRLECGIFVWFVKKPLQMAQEQLPKTVAAWHWLKEISTLHNVYFVKYDDTVSFMTL